MESAYVLPGDGIFPEGITEDPDGVTFYVSGSANGTIYRGRTTEPELEVWAPGGADGRTQVLGMAVDDAGRLLACGGKTGELYAFDTGTGELVARHSVVGDPEEPALLNDVCVAGNWAYVTDSLRPIVWRVIDLGGVLVNGDGLVFVADVLYVCDNTDEPDGSVSYWLTAVRLDGPRGELLGRWERAVADTPTTVAFLDGRLFLVNSQFMARRTGTAAAPFTVSALRPPL